MIKRSIFLFAFVLVFWCSMAQPYQLRLRIVNEDQEHLESIPVQIVELKSVEISDLDGKVTFTFPKKGKYRLLIKSLTYRSVQEEIDIQGDLNLIISLEEDIQDLAELVVQADLDPFGIKQLKPVEDGGLYEGKKTEVINISKMLGNKATNNARQAYAKIPSLNIWESDNAGIQLDIGGRGLSPRRTSNFNTRQNGYDISADALGYPESYYSPPLQAVDQIEVVRGAGALQYGTQFGGMVNFKMNQGPQNEKVSFNTQNSYGAYNFFNSFNSLGGQIGKLNYYSYYQYKTGDGWRDNSEFDLHGGFTSLQYEFSSKLKLSVDYTHMQYLSRQAGGLTDNHFDENPQQSRRNRNWFRVNWNLAAILLEYQINPNIRLYSRTFSLLARRTSLGTLEPPNQEDKMEHRDLIDGKFRNLGNETRLVMDYQGLWDLRNTLLFGTRVYRGNTNFIQGFGTLGSRADFTKVDTSYLERTKSDYTFPNTNLSLFGENIFKLTKNFSLVPGFRYEYIDTRVDGSFTINKRINSFDEFEEEIRFENKQNGRHIFLFGLGASKKFKSPFEIYANATMNYRAINFTDVQIRTALQEVDPSIQDEKGSTIDIGIRRLDYRPYYLEASFFLINYNNRIGVLRNDDLLLRTNIGRARIFGFELFHELNLFEILGVNPHEQKASIFFNGTISEGRYLNIGGDNEVSVTGARTKNRIEELPIYNIKSGFTYKLHDLSLNFQTTYVSAQFASADNHTTSNTGVQGIVPAYFVADWTSSYAFNENVKLQVSVNNIFDEAYFTRRAIAYPGPGIIPAQGRVWYFTLNLQI